MEIRKFLVTEVLNMYHPELRESNLSMFIPGEITIYMGHIRIASALLNWQEFRDCCSGCKWCAGTWVGEHLPNYMQLTFILVFLLHRACWMVSCGASCGIEEWREGAETMSLRHSQMSSADSRITRVSYGATVQTWCWNSALNRGHYSVFVWIVPIQDFKAIG